jgi:hypothetical protein
MTVKTDSRESGASNLVQYIQRDRSEDAVQSVELKHPAGRELSDAEVEQFVEKSRAMQFQRHMIVSPDPSGQYTPEEVGKNTRELMNREFGQQPTAEYVDAVHRDTDFPHAHVAITARKRELAMNRTEIDRVRERAADIYNEPERAQEAAPTETEEATRTPSQTVSQETREELHERELAMEEHPEKEVLRATERAEERGPSGPPSEPERDESRTKTIHKDAEADREADPVPAPESEPESEQELEPKPESEPDREIEPDLEREQDWMMDG